MTGKYINNGGNQQNLKLVLVENKTNVKLLVKWNKRNDVLSQFYQYQKGQGKSTDPTNFPKAGDFMSINLTSWVNWFKSSKLTQKIENSGIAL